ncbi:MAG: aminoacyl-tRNA deacylase [Polyangiaceae bacterium]|nr:aminoacyl-tRNA deacylase [Polyangiaceae bacterium]
MAKEKISVTAAMRGLRDAKVDFTVHQYRYQERGGTALSSTSLGVSESQVIKTIVLEDESKSLVVALMHGDAEVSTKKLARLLGVKSLSPAASSRALPQTGYQFGGTSPFGLKRRLPVFAQRSILRCPLIYINGGRRGTLVAMDPQDISRALEVEFVEIKA